MREYIKEFGTDHLYNCDTFNEMDPSSKNPDYIKQSARAIFQVVIFGMSEPIQRRQLISLCIQAMESEDSKAVWIMQGWLFLYSDFWEEPQIKAILSGAPQGSMIILDLDSTYQEQYSRTQGYYGLQPFIFNDLSNFGGGLGLFGRWDNINQRPFEARNITGSEYYPKMYHFGPIPDDIFKSDDVQMPIATSKLTFGQSLVAMCE